MNAYFFPRVSLVLFICVFFVAGAGFVNAQTPVGSASGSMPVLGQGGQICAGDGCDGEFGCSEPYIFDGSECCLDVNDNGLCDDSETPTTPTDNGGSGGGGGGGGSGSRSTSTSSGNACVSSWDCGEWTECSTEGERTRICIDTNNCANPTNVPLMVEACGDLQSIGLDGENAEENGGTLARLTGLVVGENGRPTPFGWILVLVLGGILYFVVRHYVAKPAAASAGAGTEKAGETASAKESTPVEKKKTPSKS